MKTTDEMLTEIVKYGYKCYGYPYIFLDYSIGDKKWSISWRNPTQFMNTEEFYANTPNEACFKALEFIKNNPTFFNYPTSLF